MITTHHRNVLELQPFSLWSIQNKIRLSDQRSESPFHQRLLTSSTSWCSNTKLCLPCKYCLRLLQWERGYNGTKWQLLFLHSCSRDNKGTCPFYLGNNNTSTLQKHIRLTLAFPLPRVLIRLAYTRPLRGIVLPVTRFLLPPALLSRHASF